MRSRSSTPPPPFPSQQSRWTPPTEMKINFSSFDEDGFRRKAMLALAPLEVAANDHNEMKDDVKSFVVDEFRRKSMLALAPLTARRLIATSMSKPVHVNEECYKPKGNHDVKESPAKTMNVAGNDLSPQESSREAAAGISYSRVSRMEALVSNFLSVDADEKIKSTKNLTVANIDMKSTTERISPDAISTPIDDFSLPRADRRNARWISRYNELLAYKREVFPVGTPRILHWEDGCRTSDVVTRVESSWRSVLHCLMRLDLFGGYTFQCNIYNILYREVFGKK